MYILNGQGTIAPLNHTFIALIPKVSKPRRVSKYKSINLCNIIYRIVTKVIVNRLRHILHYVISPTQSAFIPNRLITDNIIIEYESLHKTRHIKVRKKGIGSFKA